MKVEAQKNAFSLFIAGVPIRAIARQLGVHRSSVERWSSAGHWQIARARATAEAHRFSVAEQHRVKTMQRRSVGETVLAIFTQASAEHVAYLTGRLPRSACHYSARELMYLSLAAGGILRIDEQRDGLLDQAIKAMAEVHIKPGRGCLKVVAGGTATTADSEAG